MTWNQGKDTGSIVGRAGFLSWGGHQHAVGPREPHLSLGSGLAPEGGEAGLESDPFLRSELEGSWDSGS